MCIYVSTFPGCSFGLHRGALYKTAYYKGMVQGIVWGLFPAGRVGNATRFEKGAGFCHAVIAMEAEINAAAPWRKDQGHGEVARSRRGFECSCCEIHGPKLEWDQQSNLVHEVWIKFAKSQLKEWCRKPRDFSCPHFRVRNNFFHPFCVWRENFHFMYSRKENTAK